MKGFLASLAIFALAITGMAGVARAQGQAQQQADSQPGVARVSLIEGNVSIQRADSGEWVAATVNTPLMNGDTISTGPNSRAEVQLDYANVLRLDSSSTAKIANLNRNQIQVQVAEGLVSYDVLNQDQAQAEIDTPNVAVHPLGNGSYRVEVDSNAQTLVTVRRGEADVSTPQGSTRVENGQLITVEGANNPQYQISTAGPEDSWDRWNAQRDRRIENASTWNYTDHYYTGAQDLAPYGRWIYVPGYGSVWQPYQTAGWAPYRDGRWVWEPFYGWTWVSYQPWGWAPYHYGRWFLYANDWCWWPGPVAYYPNYYPVWAPAYVSFFGFGYAGANFSIGIGFGNVGWIPIGPADPFFPWYGAGRRFNVFNIYDFNHIRDGYDRDRGFAPLYRGRDGYSNLRMLSTDRRIRDGASWMSSREFGRAPVPRMQNRIREASFRQAKMFSGRVPVLPTRQSLRSINRAPDPASMRRGIGPHERFFTNGHHAPAQTSFSQQRAQLERSIRNYHTGAAPRGRVAFTSRPRGSVSFSARGSNVRNGSRSQGFTRGVTAGPNFTKQQSNWHRFGNSGQQRPVRPSRAPAQRGFSPSARLGGSANPRSGWHGFGQANRGPSGNRAQINQGRSSPSFGRSNRGGSAPAGRSGNFHAFTPSPRQSQPQQGRFSPARPSANRSGQNRFSAQPGQQRTSPPARGVARAPVNRQGGWRTFTPSSRPASQRGVQQGRSGRQPLNLRQPIVQRRSFGNQGPRNYGPRNYSRPSYNGPAYRGGSRPSYHPSYRAPAPQRSYGGGYRRGGGGYSRGGGGGRSAPRGRSGGSRSSGGHGHGR